MDKNTLQHVDKAAYITLVVLAAIAILIAMIAGPLEHETLSIGASVSAILIAGLLLLRTVRAMRSINK